LEARKEYSMNPKINQTAKKDEVFYTEILKEYVAQYREVLEYQKSREHKRRIKTS